MSFTSGWKVFGHGIEKVFAWIASPSGQATIAVGESTVEALVPASLPIINLINLWGKRAFAAEALAVAAGKSSGSGIDKAELVMQTMTPDLLQYVKEMGLPARTAEQIKIANDGIVAVLKALTESTPANTGIVPPAVAA